MKYLKRYTICLLANHKWLRIGYPVGSDGEVGGYFLRCGRCEKEDHNAGTVPRGAGGA